ncbi:MAG: DNA-directed RNA polymerase subunit alpha [Candidatus Kerfeldbacteria bacterium CG08_land_8_20_14_0_20_42_7]|uniref:DNA-directed RNA polymerase subunit alpha n=1 Tax=Candidatus Kerfeldbacteria bacterium CG08_land_8_20_14_0_20_42_7 TaxID=2014245 RepID=A0A2H0YSR2_9BACT|nr:MAG: DNA-directed RNA polymerase subunit alpha [Candidatus Kerfeldbacteria bacterium CG08_land_8_20_14_0_20_42_7]
MEELIPLPSKIEIQKGSNSHERIFIIEPCYPGYGITLGNALRRVLLSSMPGAAIVSAHVKDVAHEFSTLPGVKEDIVELMLNLKKIRVKLFADEPIKIELREKGEKVVTAKDLKVTSDVEVANPDQVIATLTDKNAVLEMTLVAKKGRGYVPSEQQTDDNKEIGTITLDAIYTPVKNVNFTTEHVRVGEMTNYDKLSLTVTTDGTVSPEEAFSTASKILVEHFDAFANRFAIKQVATEKPKKKLKKKEGVKE